jgi:hypothetical protein
LTVRLVFLDEHAARFFDSDHAGTEDRILMLGASFQLRTLLVCQCLRAGDAVKQQCDFGAMKGEPNPHLRRLKQPVTIRLDAATVAYHKSLAGKLGMPAPGSVFGWKRTPCPVAREHPEATRG